MEIIIKIIQSVSIIVRKTILQASWLIVNGVNIEIENKDESDRSFTPKTMLILFLFSISIWSSMCLICHHLKDNSKLSLS